jgi:phosphatidylserine decarboxylase
MHGFHLIPQHILSRFIGWLANRRWPVFLKNAGISWFIRHYGVCMEEALISDYKQYARFNDFFTRKLKPGVRPINDEPNSIASPVDGLLYELAKIEHGKLFQAKNRYYSLSSLLGNDLSLAQTFASGHSMTLYLAPKNYHRIHMPVSGSLQKMIYVPGRLFPVNQASADHISNLFARNERVISIFETELGKMAVIAVGALNVGSIITAWHGQVTPNKSKKIQSFDYHPEQIVLNRGEEMGYFQLGSTVILLFESSKIRWLPHFRICQEILLGEKIGAHNELDTK